MQTVSEAELDRPYWRMGADGHERVASRLSRALRPVVDIARSVTPRQTTTVVVAQVLSGVATTIALLVLNEALLPISVGGAAADRLRDAVPSFMLLLGAYALKLGLDTVAAMARAALAPKVRRAAEERLFRATLGVDLASFDDSDFYDRLKRARDRGVLHLEGAITTLVDMLGACLTTAGAAAALALISPLLVPLLLPALLPGAWGALTAAKVQFGAMDATVALMRRADMYGELATRRAAAPEIRANGAQAFVLDSFAAAADQLERHLVEVARREAAAKSAASLLTGIGTATAFVALALMIRAGWIGLAAAGTSVVAMRTAGAALSQLIVGAHLLLEKAIYIGDYRGFVEMAERHRDQDAGLPVPGAPGTISLEDVGFRYPGADSFALRRIDLDIRSGETIALAGENGSGKTTLAKVIAGLYSASEGVVRWDGLDVRRFSRDGVGDQVAMVLQEPVRWPQSARVNVEIGRPAASGTDEARFRAAIEQSGADEVGRRLPQGWSTLLSREFRGGQDLSAGQWQRLAIARGLFRDAPLVIWDEPTAPLDAKAELAAYESLRRLAEGRTVILITHRLTSIRDVDRIYFLKEGSVIEQGSHDELMVHGGDYARLFALQATLYRAAAL